MAFEKRGPTFFSCSIDGKSAPPEDWRTSIPTSAKSGPLVAKSHEPRTLTVCKLGARAIFIAWAAWRPFGRLSRIPAFIRGLLFVSAFSSVRLCINTLLVTPAPCSSGIPESRYIRLEHVSVFFSVNGFFLSNRSTYYHGETGTYRLKLNKLSF